MDNMPKSAEKWYRLWINQFPESWHPNDLERFYMFVSVLVRVSRTHRNRFWLEKNIRTDRPQLSEEDIKNYSYLFEHLQNYSNVWKSHQANQIAIDDARQDREEKSRKSLS